MPIRTDWILTSTPLVARVATERSTSGSAKPRVQHGEIRKGTLAAMLKQLEIPREEF